MCRPETLRGRFPSGGVLMMSFNDPGSPSREQLNDGPLANNKPSHDLFYGSFINESEDPHL